MSFTSLSLKFALLFSFSLARAEPLTSAIHKTNANYVNDAVSALQRPKATASDLLSLLGPPQRARSVDPQLAPDIWSGLKFLSPFPTYNQTLSARRSLGSLKWREEDADGLIMSPPAPVLELARLAVDSGADPGAIHRAIDPTVLPIPDVEGSKEDRCELTRTPYGRRFINEELNSYLEFLFKIIAKRGPNVGLNLSLSRYDLFHGHLFLATDSGRLGILFHAKEYPTFDKEVFPFNMGYCQVGSDVSYDDSMNLRNILWLAPMPSNSTKAWLAPGVLVVLDAHPEGIIYQDLIPDYVQIARTLYEDEFGEVVVDVNYLNVGAEEPNFQVFLC